MPRIPHGLMIRLQHAELCPVTSPDTAGPWRRDIRKSRVAWGGVVPRIANRKTLSFETPDCLPQGSGAMPLCRTFPCLRQAAKGCNALKLSWVRRQQTPDSGSRGEQRAG